MWWTFNVSLERLLSSYGAEDDNVDNTNDKF